MKKLLLTALMLLALAACGGGDEGDRHGATTLPVNCNNPPGQCR